MADSSGVHIAYAAYKKLAKQKPQTKLPGLENVSDDELFFLAFANVSYFRNLPVHVYRVPRNTGGVINLVFLLSVYWKLKVCQQSTSNLKSIWTDRMSSFHQRVLNGCLHK